VVTNQPDTSSNPFATASQMHDSTACTHSASAGVPRRGSSFASGRHSRPSAAIAWVTRGPVRMAPLVVPKVETAISTASALAPQVPSRR
jgi:hypothetical protein